MAVTDNANYKARKEAFVSNLSGGSISEVNLVTLVAPAAVLLWTALQKRRCFFTPYGPVPFVTDFLLNVCATLFAITAYSSAPAFLDISLVTPAILLLLPLQKSAPSANGTIKASRSKATAVPYKTTADVSPQSRLVSRPFLTHYRGGMMIITVLAILAVDFPIFPRRFAKAETWGTSLMDLGVGSFVFSAGVVSARALYKEDQGGARPGVAARTFNATRHSIPLLVLGIIRLLSVKGLDYAEHVTEYGVHWNFFFTLAFLPPFVELADSLLKLLFRQPELKYNWLALVIAAVYEILLDNTRLLSYILISPRGPSLLSKNREGVFSFIGYLSIFLAGRGTGYTVVGLIDNPVLKQPRHVDHHTRTNKERTLIQRSLVSDSILHSFLYIASTSIYGLNLNVSRRLANLPYVLWVLAFNNVQLLLLAVIESFGPKFSYHKDNAQELKNASSQVMQVFNQNGLVVFLVANLLTGLVNLSVDTLNMGSLGAMGVLIAYAAVVTGVAGGLRYTGVKIKL